MDLIRLEEVSSIVEMWYNRYCGGVPGNLRRQVLLPQPLVLSHQVRRLPSYLRQGAGGRGAKMQHASRTTNNL